MSEFQWETIATSPTTMRMPWPGGGWLVCVKDGKSTNFALAVTWAPGSPEPVATDHRGTPFYPYSLTGDAAAEAAP